MDPLAALQAEVKKRKATQATATSTRRWRSQAEIEREREKAYRQREKEEEEQRQHKRLKTETATVSNVREITKQVPDSADNKGNTNDQNLNEFANSRDIDKSNEQGSQIRSEDEPPLPKAEVIRRLRLMKQPATYFGENDWDRFYRLREHQLSLEDQSDGQRNLYQKKMREVREKEAKEDVHDFIGVKRPTPNSRTDQELEQGALNYTENDCNVTCKEDFVHAAIRKYMRLWYSEIDAMSREERRTNKGRSQLVTYEQTKHWLQPLEKLLRKRKLSKTILDALRDIFEAAARREYMLAMRLYLERLAIGNAPWPMGATQVGIHSRAAREKIGEDKIAHVMNDEETRKYIQAVKRVLTVAQRRFPTNPSKMMST